MSQRWYAEDFPSAARTSTISEMAILVVDDDQAVRDALRRALRMQGYDVSLAGDGEEALLKLRANPGATDLLIVDILMPRLDGLEMTRRLRADGSQVPILMLTARDQVADRVAGLEAGADDYLVKPFALEELIARVRALLRRLGSDETATTLTFADLELDTGTREVRRGDETLTLTRTEFALLELFLRNPKQVLTRSVIFDRVWGYDFGYGSNSLDVYIIVLAQEDGVRREAAADPHGSRRRLRAPGAVSLRARLGLVAAAAVAAAVALASVVVYFIVQNELRGQVDRSLRDQVAAGRPARRLPFDLDDHGPEQYRLDPRAAATRSAARSSSSTSDGGLYRPVDSFGPMPQLLPGGRAGARAWPPASAATSTPRTHFNGQHVRAARRRGCPDGLRDRGGDAADERRPRARRRSACGCCSSRSAASGSRSSSASSSRARRSSRCATSARRPSTSARHATSRSGSR